MPRSRDQSEFDFKSPEVDREQELAERGASRTSTRWVFIALAVALVVLFLLVAVALHMPSGE